MTIRYHTLIDRCVNIHWQVCQHSHSALRTGAAEALTTLVKSTLSFEHNPPLQSQPVSYFTLITYSELQTIAWLLMQWTFFQLTCLMFIETYISHEWLCESNLAKTTCWRRIRALEHEVYHLYYCQKFRTSACNGIWQSPMDVIYTVFMFKFLFTEKIQTICQAKKH